MRRLPWWWPADAQEFGQSPAEQKVLEELNSMPVFQRIAGYASGNVLTPTLWRYLDL